MVTRITGKLPLLLNSKNQVISANPTFIVNSLEEILDLL